MTTIWLIAALAGGFFLLGIQSASLIFQYFHNRRLEKRVTSLGQQLQHVPKRRSDRITGTVVE